MCWTIWGSILSRYKRFISSQKLPGQLWGPASFLSMGVRSSFLWVKMVVHETDHSPLASAKVMNEWDTGTILLLFSLLHDHNKSNTNITY